VVSGVLQGLRFIRTWLAVGGFLVGLVIYLSLTPDPISAPQVEGVKSGHFVAYLVLMLWFWQLVRPRGAKIAIAVALVAMGIALEFVQGATGYRTFAFADMRDNALGVGSGFILGMTPLGGMLGKFEAWLTRKPTRQ
jgi:VanZ family protein